MTPISDAVRAVRPGPAFLGLLAVTGLGGWLLTTTEPGRGSVATIGAILLMAGGWIISLCLHEFGHAVTAFAAGDHNPRTRSYLTLDPRKYADPMLSVFFPLFILAIGGIGLPGGAVYIDPSRMTRAQRSRVAAAGPIANIVLAIILLIVIREFAGTAFTSNFWWVMAALANLQVFAAVLNLLPVPGLDGYHIIEPWLPAHTQRRLDRFQPFGFLILLGVFFLVPPIRDAFGDVVSALFGLSGIDPTMSAYGWHLFLFWR